MIRVAIVSTSPMMRAGLRLLLSEERDFEVVAEGSRLEEVYDPLEESGWDLVLLGAAEGREVDEIIPESAVQSGGGLLVLGPLSGDERLPSRLAAVPWGYLSNDAPTDQIVAAARAVAVGLHTIDSSLLDRVWPVFRIERQESLDELPRELTPRELEVIDLIARGFPNKSIATRSTISEHTVKYHVASILSKLGAASRTEAAHLAARRGLLLL